MMERPLNKELYENKKGVQEDHFTTSKITESFKNHQHCVGVPCIGLPQTSFDEFLTKAALFQLGNATQRWCQKGVQAWIAFGYVGNIVPKTQSSNRFQTLSSRIFTRKDIPQCFNEKVLDSKEENTSKSFTISNSSRVSSKNYTNKTAFGGAQFHDDSGILWVTHQYTLHIHAETGGIIISKQLPKKTKKITLTTSRTDLSSTSPREDTSDVRVLEPKEKKRCRYHIITKALKLSQLSKVECLTVISPNRNLLITICGALKCVRIARGLALNDSKYRVFSKKHNKNSVMKQIKTFLTGFSVNVASRIKGFSTVSLKKAFFSEDPIHFASQDTINLSDTAKYSSFVSHSKVSVAFKPGSQNKLTQIDWYHKFHQDYHNVDPFYEFGHTTVIMTFKHTTFPLVVVFNEISDAEEFTRFVNLLKPKDT